MFKKLYFTIALTALFFSLEAQNPEKITIKGKLATSAQKKVCVNNAGTISFGTHTGQSNSVMSDTIYLCFGDQIEILHDPGTSDLSSDPNLLTPAGIVYPYYDCPPTLGNGGPLLSDIVNDNCLNKTSPIILNGMSVEQEDSLWIEAGDINGNVTFVNDGSIQTAFNGGEPILFFYAPMTIDDFAGRNFEPDSVGITGSCVNINIAETFGIVFLNEIQVTDVNNNIGDNGCSGSFRITGGLPEFDSLARFDVEVSLASDPTIRGSLQMTRFRNNEVVEFFIPQPGIYNVVIEDGVSCGAQFTIDMAGCEAVTFNIGESNVLPGDTACVDITVSNFNDILLLEGRILWDSSLIDLVEVTNVNNALLGFDTISSSISTALKDQGILAWSWFDLSFSGVTLPDNAILFTLCFEGIGPLGVQSDLDFNSDRFEIVRASNDERLGFILNNGALSLAQGNVFSDYDITEVTCFGDNDGGFTVMLSGGNAPYQINWQQLESAVPRTGNGTINADGNSLAFNGLPGGDYEISIQDASAETRIDTINIFSPPSLGINLVNTLPRCSGESTGSIVTELIVGGQIITDPGSEYTFQWNSTPMNVEALQDIPSGFYGVTVTDSRGCQALASTTLADPPTLDASPVISPASCPGVADGAIEVSPNGGTAPYTFTWQPGLEMFNGTFTSSNPTSLGGGTYGVTITDANSCEITRSFTVNNAKTLAVNEVITDVSCNGADDGSILVTGTSNIPEPPYNFTWENEASLPTPPINTNTTSELSNLSPGTYNLTLTDSGPAACQLTTSFIITEPEALNITVLSQTEESCIPGGDASVVVGVTGGTFPYAYAWSNNDTDSIAANLTAGIYNLTLTDNNNCIDSLEVPVFQLTPPMITTLDDFTLTCDGDTDGILNVMASAAAGATLTDFSWSNGQNTETITNLSAGTYVVTVTQDDGCIAIDTGLVVSPGAIVITDVVPTPPTCAGFSDGSLNVVASGGTMPYQYIWENTPQNDTLSFSLYPSLSAGIYNLTVVDANNCSSATSRPTLPDAPAIQVSFTDPVSVSCRDLTCDGQITANADYSDGTTGTFEFRWETGEVTDNDMSSRAVRLCAGFQSITITDVNSCFLIDSVDVPAPASIEVGVDATAVSCNGFSDGIAEVNVTGGVSPYRFEWIETTQTTQAISGLAAGTYNVIILDGNDCQVSQQVEISEPDALMLSIDLNLTQDVQCAGEMNGVIAVAVNDTANINDLRPLPYTWSDNIAPADTNVASNLSAGTYGVTITDVRGCQDSLSISLNEPTPIMADIPEPVPPRCFGELTQIIINDITGGNGTMLFDYTYSVDNSGLDFAPDQPAQVRAGVHVITIEDLLGCTFTTTVDIPEPDRIQVAFSPDVIEIELGDTTQQLIPIISSSLPVDSFLWTPADFLSANDVQRPTVIPIDDRTYTLRVVDVNGCDAEGRITVEVDRNRNVFIPNIFTPDGDGNGLNEEFRIFACNGVQNINYARLYDRWGNMIVDRSNLGPACEGGIPIWDGRFRGKRMNSGVYVYVVEVEFVDGITLVYRGDVALVK